MEQIPPEFSEPPSAEPLLHWSDLKIFRGCINGIMARTNYNYSKGIAILNNTKLSETYNIITSRIMLSIY